MPIFTRDGRSVLFVHVPKTGGSSIERMLTRAGWQMGFRATPRTDPEQFRYYRVSPQHYHAELLRQALRLGRFDATFLVVRDPIARFRSEYVMRNRKQDSAGSAAHVEAWAREVMGRARRNPYVLDNHLRPQHEFVLPQATVFRLEEGMDSIIERLNIEWDLGLSGEVAPRLVSGADGGLASRDVRVNAAVERVVRDFYARDYEVFGYA